MAQCRVGVVGVGTFGINHLRCFRQLGYIGVAELVAAADINEELVNQRTTEGFDFNPYTSVEEMLANEELDAVTIVTPDPFHKEVALKAAEAGVHILSEKPLDVTVEGCQEMIDAAEANDVLLMVDFHKRYDEYHIAMKQKLQSGALGEIEYGYSHMEDRIEVPKDWFTGWAQDSSPAWFLGIHFYDLSRYLMETEPTRVWATGVKKRLLEFGIDSYDSISAKVEFDNGATVAFDTCWILPYEFEAVVNQGIRLVGTTGLLECDSQDRGTITCCEGEGMMTHNQSFLRQRHDKKGREIWEGYGMDSIADFAQNVNVLLEGGSIEDIGDYPSGYDGLQATRLAAGVHESLETKGIVEL